jgi:penicillin-binding protein 1A
MIRRLLFIGIIICCALLGGLVVLLEKDWVDFSALDAYKTAQSSVVLDEDGEVISRFELDKCAPVLYDQLPDVLVKAFVAAEDHTFFDHYGISLKAIARSMFVNLYHRRVMQGASTITQQLAKLMFLSYERTWWRKLQEIFLAFQLERQLSKEQILETYLNNIYFGRGIYGVEAACRRFWNKSLDRLTIDEAATLASVAKSALLYSPLNAPANSKRRRDWILGNMCRLGFISKEQKDKAMKAKLHIHDCAIGNPMRLYVQEWVRTWAENKWGKDVLYTKGLKIKTTLNLAMQEKAEKAFKDVIQELRMQLGDAVNGGLLSMDPESGQIKAMIGGYDFKQSQFNRAFQARRQIGSTVKPMLYALGMKAGIGMDAVFVDEPLEITMPNGNLWTPRNWYNQFEGAMTLVRALTVSCNTIAVKLFMKIGGDYMVPWLQRFGITSCLTSYPSAALGTAEATLEENMAAFNVFANNGIWVKPYFIEWVKDGSGNKMYESQTETRRVIDSLLCSRMVNALSYCRLLNIQKQKGDWIDADTIGKTGSTNGAATTWFVGATPSLTTAIYVGRDDNKPIRLLAGRTTVPIWTRFYQSIKTPKKHFYLDPNLKEYTINWITGCPADKQDTDPNVVTLLI